MMRNLSFQFLSGSQSVQSRLGQGKVKRLGLKAFFGLIAVWLALLDHCLIVASEMPISGPAVVLLLLQAGMGSFALLLINGAIPAMATNRRSGRINLIVFGVPLIFFLISPAMISDAMYRARYGSIDKFVVHAHVGHDLGCCWNPFIMGMDIPVFVCKRSKLP